MFSEDRHIEDENGGNNVRNGTTVARLIKVKEREEQDKESRTI